MPRSRGPTDKRTPRQCERLGQRGRAPRLRIPHGLTDPVVGRDAIGRPSAPPGHATDGILPPHTGRPSSRTDSLRRWAMAAPHGYPEAPPLVGRERERYYPWTWWINREALADPSATLAAACVAQGGAVRSAAGAGIPRAAGADRPRSRPRRGDLVPRGAIAANWCARCRAPLPPLAAAHAGRLPGLPRHR